MSASTSILTRVVRHIVMRVRYPGRVKVTRAWRDANGDKTLRLQYPLSADSVVLDVGGFEGQWASDTYAMYRCRIHVFEPVPPFAQQIATRFKANPDITVHPYGLGARNEQLAMAILGDKSSTLQRSSTTCQATIKMAADFFQEHHLTHVDLMKINIEGGEFDLLEHMLDTNLIAKIDNIQVQFHHFIPDAKEKTVRLQKRLAQTHQLTWQYPFVWENWRIITRRT
jgi:FkbM family methyltransferase